MIFSPKSQKCPNQRILHKYAHEFFEIFNTHTHVLAYVCIHTCVRVLCTGSQSHSAYPSYHFQWARVYLAFFNVLLSASEHLGIIISVSRRKTTFCWNEYAERSGGIRFICTISTPHFTYSLVFIPRFVSLEIATIFQKYNLI